MSDKPTYDELKNQIAELKKQHDLEIKAKEKIEAEHKKYLDFYNNSPLMLQFSSQNAEISEVNNSWLHKMGYKKEEVINTKSSKYLTPSSLEKFKTLYPEFLKNGVLNDVEFQLIKKNGEIFDVSASTIINTDKNGEYLNNLTYLIDISDRKQSELIINQQNNELKKLNTDKDRFMQILAHDLRSPFNSLLGLSQCLLEDVKCCDIENIEKQVNIINQSAQNTYNLLNDLLVWTKSQQGIIPFEPQKLKLFTICNEVLETIYPMAIEKNIIINCLKLDDKQIFADSDMLKTILRNLVTNAIKYTNKGGAIEITAKSSDSKTTVSVSDTGIGIKPDNFDKLFDFSQVYTTLGTEKESGTGLGLPLCKYFVKKHGGDIWVNSEIGLKTSFNFTIPGN